MDCIKCDCPNGTIRCREIRNKTCLPKPTKLARPHIKHAAPAKNNTTYQLLGNEEMRPEKDYIEMAASALGDEFLTLRNKHLKKIDKLESPISNGQKDGVSSGNERHPDLLSGSLSDTSVLTSIPDMVELNYTRLNYMARA